MLQAGVITKMVLEDQGRGGATFETASAPSAFGPGGYALVRFVETATVADITRFLGMRDATIVDGPRPRGPGGMYRLRLSDMPMAKAELEQAVRELSSSNGLVSFAAPAE